MSSLATLLTTRLYTVRGDSMRPSFWAGEQLLVGRPAFSRWVPTRLDVIVFRDPRHSDRMYLKRVVGMPGEEISLSEGLLCVDGQHLDEPHLGGLPASPGLGERTWRLGDHEYFLLGDQRVRSTDSREFGPVAAELFIGKVWLRFWPPARWRLI